MNTSATLRWGVFGTGNMASQIARALPHVPGTSLTAVASRSQRRADGYAREFGVPHAFGSYDALLAHPDVDVVYVATPHTEHHEHTLAALAAGKHVLCEKPFALNAAEAQEMVAEARNRNLFLMEAVWMRYLPLMDDLRAIVTDGRLGTIRMLHADFGFRAEYNPASRLFDPNLAGGSLLDVGVYPVNLASLLFGAPAQIATLAHFGATGVDEQAAITMRYGSGALAVLSSSIRADTPNEAHITGDNGTVKLHNRWWVPERMTVTLGEHSETVHKRMTGNGYAHELAEVQRCITAGLTESPLMPLDETLGVMQTLDQIRASWGLRYPQERARGA